MNQLVFLTILLLVPVSQNQRLPGAYYQLPIQIREQATVIAAGKYGWGRTPYIWRRDGTQVWARTSWFRLTKVYRGEIGGESVYLNSSMLPNSKYVSTRLEVGHEYLVLLRRGLKSRKPLNTGEQLPLRDDLRSEEIIAIVELRR